MGLNRRIAAGTRQTFQERVARAAENAGGRGGASPLTAACAQDLCLPGMGAKEVNPSLLHVVHRRLHQHLVLQHQAPAVTASQPAASWPQPHPFPATSQGSSRDGPDCGRVRDDVLDGQPDVRLDHARQQVLVGAVGVGLGRLSPGGLDQREQVRDGAVHLPTPHHGPPGSPCSIKRGLAQCPPCGGIHAPSGA